MGQAFEVICLQLSLFQSTYALLEEIVILEALREVALHFHCVGFQWEIREVNEKSLNAIKKHP